MSGIYQIMDFPTNGKKYGRYIAKTPLIAANKAFNKLTNYFDMKNNNMLIFSIRNSSTGRVYKYIGTRVELYKPLVINKGGKNIIYNSKNIITKYFDGINNS
jgi:hypothetical protein